MCGRNQAFHKVAGHVCVRPLRATVNDVMIAPERRHGGAGNFEDESASCKACYPLLAPYKHSGSTQIITPRRFRFGVTSNGVRLRHRSAHLRRRWSTISLASCSQSLVVVPIAILAMWKPRVTCCHLQNCRRAHPSTRGARAPDNDGTCAVAVLSVRAPHVRLAIRF